jgi:hypothetical protein
MPRDSFGQPGGNRDVTTPSPTIRQAEPSRKDSGRRGGGFAWRLPYLARLRQPGLRERFARLAASTTAIRQRTEPGFLELARDLGALHEGAAELSRTTREHVTSLRDVLEQNRLNGGGAERALEALQRGLREAEDGLRMLRRTSEAIRRLHGQGRQLERLASLLEVSGYGFAVESARSLANQRAFGAFVTGLRKLAARIGALGAAMAEQAESAQNESERLNRTMTASLAELGKLTERAERTVRETAARVERVLTASWTALEEAERDTALIAAHASAAVYHLQFGDIVRQKLEHVAAALEEAAPEHAGDVLPVEAGQLELVGEEIASARRQLDQAFAGLAEDARRLAGTIGRAGGESEDREAGEDPLEELGAAFAQIEELEHRGSELCAGARATYDRATEAAGRLSQHMAEVEDINRQMHIQALNAIVKTALLGEEGRTLEVLSIHVQRVFGESRELVVESVGMIESLSTDANRRPAGDGAPEDTASALRRGLDQLARVRDEFQRAMRAAAAGSERQSAALAQARLSLGFLSEMEAEVAALRREVAEVHRSVPGAAPAGVHPVVLAGRYTIESEREVHRRMTQAAGPPRSQEDAPAEARPEDGHIDPAPSATAAPEEDLGDNVELF